MSYIILEFSVTNSFTFVTELSKTTACTFDAGLIHIKYMYHAHEHLMHT